MAEESELIQGHLKIKRNAIGNTQSLLKNSNATPALQNLKERLQNFTKIEKALPGENFKGILRPYQQEGLNWLSFLADYDFHGMLADDMGLGKTVQVLAFLSRLRLEKPCLIVMPTSLLFNWKKEIEKFLPNISFCIHHGIKRAKTKEELTTYSIILTSYSTLRMDLLLFQKIPLQALILDEAQAIKNSNTQTAQSVYSLQADFRLSITGTPIENHLNELWSQFHFLIPDLFEDQSQFNADLQAAAVDSRYLQKIRKKVAPFILRRKKEEVAKDLPERIDQIVWLQMPEEQQSIYDQFLAGVKSGLLKKIEIDGLAKHRIAVFEAILRLRQICCHPLLIPSFLDEDTPLPPSIKIDSLFQDLETIVEEKGKVLIYSQFTSMLQIMAKESKNRGWKFVYLDGSTTNREKVIDSFQNDPEVSLFFISLKAGGVGLNLTAADYVFIYDPWWNDAVEEQAINRAHRIGRTKTVFTKKFITLQSIEEKMMKLKEAKKDLFNQIMDEEIHMQNLTLDDLKYLLE